MPGPVIGYLWRWAVLLSGLWLLPIFIFRAQPYDSSALRAFLTPPEDCPAPCFMGIRPGVTDIDTAVTVLDEHPWVLWDDESPQSFRTAFQLTWTWGEAAPTWIERQNVALVSVYDGVVGGPSLRTTIARAEFLLAFGRPDRSRLIPNDDVLTGAPVVDYRYEAWYSDLGLMLLAIGECSAAETSYDWSVVLFFQAEPPSQLSSPAHPLVTPCHKAVQ